MMSTMGLLWGTKVFFYDPSSENMEMTVKSMAEKLKAENLLAKGDKYVATLSSANQNDKKTNTVMVGVVE